MDPKEVDKIIEGLQEAAEELAFVRQEWENVDWKIKGKLTVQYTLRERMMDAVSHAESAIRVALATVGSSNGEAGNLK